MLGCQVRLREAVYVHTVGTFGVASVLLPAAGRRGRSGASRSTVPETKADTWHVLVADDFHLKTGNPDYRPPRSSPSSLFVSSPGVPLSLDRKTAAGDVVTWVGFELLPSSYQLRISQRRADWFVKWTRTTTEQETVPHGQV